MTTFGKVSVIIPLELVVRFSVQRVKIYGRGVYISFAPLHKVLSSQSSHFNALGACICIHIQLKKYKRIYTNQETNCPSIALCT